MMRLFSRLLVISLAFGLIFGEVAHAANFGKPRLEIVAQLKQRPGNVAVAKDGRVFISMHPFDNPEFKVMEVLPEGTLKPYPSPMWSKEPGADGVGLTRVVHLAVVGDTLYIMDMGSDLATPKMVAWDIKANALKRLWYMPGHVLTKKSFLQDFVISPDEHTAVIADMGQADFSGKPDAALIYLNLERGTAVRKLMGHASLRPSQKPMRADGVEMRFTKDGRDFPLYLGLNPITLDPKGTWLYYGPMGQGLIYKVLLRDFISPELSNDELGRRVAVCGRAGPHRSLRSAGKTLAHGANHRGRLGNFRSGLGRFLGASR